MMKPRWHMPKPMLSALVAAGLFAIHGLAVAAKTDDWKPPLTVSNPFCLPQRPADAAPDPWADAYRQKIAGGLVEAELPPIYRLPPIDGGAQPAEPRIDPAPAARPALPARRDAASAEDILPLSNEPSDDLLQTMEDLWQEPAFDESASARDEPVSAFEASMSAFDAASAFPYTPTAAELSQHLLPSVRKGFGLAQRGATYAAQTEFVQVLRRIAQAKDAELGTDEHSRFLAAGLRALDEADDFMPDGVELEAEMNVAVIASSHRTPVLAGRASTVLPHEAIALYHQYAEVELGRAVAGERAGAMALYGLGKVSNRLALESDGNLRHQHKAMTMFLASLATAPDNHLAANEAGVLLSRGGHHGEAAAMFRRAIDVAPMSTSYHNLAVVEQKLGRHAEAVANQRYAEQLAARDRATGGVSRRQGVTWVTPDELARVAQPLPLPPAQVHPQMAGRMQAAATPPGARQAPPRSAWQKTVELAKSLPLPGKSASSGAAPVHVAQPNLTTGPQWR